MLLNALCFLLTAWPTHIASHVLLSAVGGLLLLSLLLYFLLLLCVVGCPQHDPEVEGSCWTARFGWDVESQRGLWLKTVDFLSLPSKILAQAAAAAAYIQERFSKSILKRSAISSCYV